MRLYRPTDISKNPRLVVVFERVLWVLQEAHKATDAIDDDLQDYFTKNGGQCAHDDLQDFVLDILTAFHGPKFDRVAAHNNFFELFIYTKSNPAEIWQEIRASISEGEDNAGDT